jgi:hypothetical protein
MRVVVVEGFGQQLSFVENRDYFPIQKFSKILFKISSLSVLPTTSSSIVIPFFI